jgi:hypothetical protein
LSECGFRAYGRCERRRDYESSTADGAKLLECTLADSDVLSERDGQIAEVGARSAAPTDYANRLHTCAARRVSSVPPANDRCRSASLLLFPEYNAVAIVGRDDLVEELADWCTGHDAPGLALRNAR